MPTIDAIGSPSQRIIVAGMTGDKLFLGYLMAAPFGATVLATVTYDGPTGGALFALWLAGAVAVSVYATFLGAYFAAPRGWRALVAIVDGPLFVVAAALALHGWDLLELLTWFFAAESIGIYLGFALVAWRKLQRNAGPIIGIMIVCIAIVCVAMGWSLLPELRADWRAAVMFAASIGQSTIGTYWVIRGDGPNRDSERGAAYVGWTLGLFHVAIGVGALLRFVVL